MIWTILGSFVLQRMNEIDWYNRLEAEQTLWLLRGDLLWWELDLIAIAGNFSTGLSSKLLTLGILLLLSM